MIEQQRIAVVVSACHVVMDEYRSCLGELGRFNNIRYDENFLRIYRSQVVWRIVTDPFFSLEFQSVTRHPFIHVTIVLLHDVFE